MTGVKLAEVEVIDITPIDITPIDLDNPDQPALLDRALILLDDTEAQPVFSEGTWNQIENGSAATRTLLNPSGVSTGWDFTNSAFSTNPLSLGTTPFYDAAVYAIRRERHNVAESYTHTFVNLNDTNRYTFIITGASTSPTGLNTQAVTLSSDVSADTATIFTDPSNTDLEHRGEISGQVPVAGSISITLLGTGTDPAVVSTIEIQENE